MDNSKIKGYLCEWTQRFIKNRDLIARSIKEISKNSDECDLVVVHKDRTEKVIVVPFLDGSVDIKEKVSALSTDSSYVTIVLFNNRENLLEILKEWKSLVSFSTLKLIFANPFSKLEKKWLIFPSTHNRVCDEDSLELGLKSMYESVEPISLKEAEKLVG